jgi:hypothetical protein
MNTPCSCNPPVDFFFQQVLSYPTSLQVTCYFFTSYDQMGVHHLPKPKTLNPQIPQMGGEHVTHKKKSAAWVD